MSNNEVLLKIICMYPISLLTIYILYECLYSKFNFTLVEYNKKNNNNKKLKARKEIISNSNKYIILTLIFIILNIYLAIQKLIGKIINLNKKTFTCVSNSEYEDRLRNNGYSEDDIKTIRTKCKNINQLYTTNQASCNACSSIMDDDGIYQCNYISTTSGNRKPLSFDENTCDAFEDKSKNVVINYFLKNFLVIFISCLCINFLLSKTIYKIIFIILYVLIILFIKIYFNNFELYDLIIIYLFLLQFCIIFFNKS